LVSRLRIFGQYALIIAAMVLLVWLSLRSLQVEEGHNKTEYIVNTWHAADKGWLSLMVVFFMASNVLRAERWKMLLVSIGHPSSLYRSFLSLMIGYLVNLVVPRGGEISRCYNLYKLNKTPVEVSFGTVIVERVIDVICLSIVLVLAFAVESDKLFDFIASLPYQSLLEGDKARTIVMLLIAGSLLGVAGFWLISRNQTLKERSLKAWAGFKAGLSSIARLENKGLFIFYSAGIWLLYFLMTYTVIKAFDETGSLCMSVVLSVFAIGAIAMAAPLPGGTGSYHVLVPAGLVLLYQIPQSKAVAFTFVFHGWQTVILIATGIIALILTSILLRKK
jgi:glycosyltransferase 2 family protein